MKTFEFPQCWEDDKRMNALFAPFRTKNINPVDYDSKMQFWESLIEKWCTYYKEPMVEVSTLNHHFTRKDKIPSCLPEVVDHLCRRKTLVSKEDFYQMTEQSWRNWAVQVFVSRPLRWTLDKVLSSVTTKSSRSTTTFIHLPVLKNMGQEIIKKVPEDKKGELLDITYVQKISEIGNMDVLQLELHWLHNQKLIALCQNKFNMIIKFPKKENDNATITDIDKALFSLEENKRQLQRNIDRLDAEKDNLIKETKKLVAANKTQLAKSTLRRKKAVENIIQKLTVALENIENLIHQMQMAEVNSMILQCYQTGVSSLNQFFTQSGLTKDNVLSTKKEFDEIMISNSDIDNAFSELLNSEDSNQSTAELEEELKILLTDDKDIAPKKQPGQADSSLLQLPEVPCEEPEISVCDNLEKKMATLAV